MTSNIDFVSPLAIVDRAVAGKIIVWHVDLMPVVPSFTSRLCGAWVLDSSDEALCATLTVGRPQTGPESTIAGQADLQATVRAMTDDTEDLDRRFAVIASHAKSPLVPPRWRRPDPITGGITPAPGDESAAVAAVLRTARRWAALADTWAHNESQRLMRPKLAEQTGPTVRPLPVAIR